MRAPTVCSVPGCPILTAVGRCERHQTEYRRANDARRPNARARGYDSRWAKVSRRYLRRNRTCVWPGCDRPSEVTDHIDGLGPKGPRGYDERNFRALCWPHHSQRTAADQPGGWNQ